MSLYNTRLFNEKKVCSPFMLHTQMIIYYINKMKLKNIAYVIKKKKKNSKFQTKNNADPLLATVKKPLYDDIVPNTFSG